MVASAICDQEGAGTSRAAEGPAFGADPTSPLFPKVLHLLVDVLQMPLHGGRCAFGIGLADGGDDLLVLHHDVRKQSRNACQVAVPVGVHLVLPLTP